MPEAGLVRRWHGLPFFEECPTQAAPTYLLHGFQQALLGLHDLAGHLTAARRLFAAGMRTLVRTLPLYELATVVASTLLRAPPLGHAPAPGQPKLPGGRQEAVETVLLTGCWASMWRSGGGNRGLRS